MNFLIDMMLSPGLAHWLANRGHDAVHASTLGLSQAPDEVILLRACRERRVIITADLDYPRLLALTKAEQPGLILFRGGEFSEHEVQKRLERLLDMNLNEDLYHCLFVVEKNRIRRRPLPLASE